MSNVQKHSETVFTNDNVSEGDSAVFFSVDEEMNLHGSFTKNGRGTDARDSLPGGFDVVDEERTVGDDMGLSSRVAYPATCEVVRQYLVSHESIG